MFTMEKVMKVVRKEISDFKAEGLDVSFYLGDEATEKEAMAFRLGVKVAAREIKIRLFLVFLSLERRKKISAMAKAMSGLSNDEFMAVLAKVLGDTRGSH